MTDEGKSGPAGEAKDCWEGSGGFDGDGGDLLLAIFEGTGGAAEDDAAVIWAPSEIQRFRDFAYINSGSLAFADPFTNHNNSSATPLQKR